MQKQAQMTFTSSALMSGIAWQLAGELGGSVSVWSVAMALCIARSLPLAPHLAAMPASWLEESVEGYLVGDLGSSGGAARARLRRGSIRGDGNVAPWSG